jgi:hypothetical protein
MSHRPKFQPFLHCRQAKKRSARPGGKVFDAMPDTPARGGIPIIGRLTVMELLGFIGLVLAAAASLWEIAWLLGEQREPAPPGMYIVPALAAFGSILLSSSIGFALLLNRVKRRLAGHAVPQLPAGPIDVSAMRRLADAMTASMIVQLVCMILPLFATTMSVGLAAAFLFTIVAAGIVFLVCLGVLASRLGKSWVLWVGMTVITPFGPFIAYFLMRKLVRKAIKSAM